MADFRNFKVFGGFGGRRKKESARLDTFLKDLADPGLIGSLRQDEDRRQRWLLAVAVLLLGLLLGGLTGWWLASRSAGRKAAAAPASHAPEDRARALAAQGLAFARAKEIPKAWTYLGLATELGPHLVDAWAAYGLAQLYGGQTNEAERAFRRCAEIDPMDPRGLQGLGEVHFYSGDYEKAEEAWLKGNAKRSVARLRLLQGRLAEAAPLVEEVARKTPDPVYTPAMLEAVRTGRLTPELRWKLGPGLVLSRSRETARGWRLYFSRQYGEAATVFGEVLGQNPRDSSARLGRGWCRLQARAYREAQADFAAVLAAGPSNYSALHGLGWSLKSQGQAAGAAQAWQQVLELQPENPEAPGSLKGLGTLALDRRDGLAASYYLSRSLLQDPFDPETRTLLESALEKLPVGGERP